MSSEENKANTRRSIEEGWNQGNVAIYDELCAPNFIYHDPVNPHVRTLEDFKRLVTEVRNTFPDLHFTIADVIADGDQVAVRWTMRGTNTGDFARPMPIPATGKQITITGISLVRVAGGRAVEVWNQGDHLGMFQQLGLIPAPGQPG